MHEKTETRARGARLTILIALTGLLLSGCGKDPMGPDNRLALMALGKCRYSQALQLTDNAIARGTAQNVHRAWTLKAAILRDRGDTKGAEALYPKIADAWQTAKGRTLTDARRERDIDLFLQVARAERQSNGLPPDCSDAPTPPGAAPRAPAGE
ncbi:MAG: hypothetical protein LJE69_05665 [Thiohalocapsa sp.]|jgi:hypothetical protein|uniref:hypothetical protein n=1 Tax=Thiohalocapsa sp. TaxID=2497641 RepID=UPI0025CD6854|nr:hypothetical protein [Thiohalocapsa sp.]MCG6940720.1 hypothetical protein [Thiohalocapsa sp.]